MSIFVGQADDYIVNTMRGFGTLLAPLMGTRATGHVVVKSTAPTGTVQGLISGIPTRTTDAGNVMAADQATLRLEKNPATEDGSWDITDAGVAIPVTSILGGKNVNVPAGSPVRWDPIQEGVELVSVVDSGGMAGGDWASEALSVKGFHQFEDVGAREAWQALMASGATKFPAVVLFWQGSDPADGNTVTRLNRAGSTVGRGKYLLSENWTLWVVTSRADADPTRRGDGLRLLQMISRELTNVNGIDGIAVSTPGGVDIHKRYRVAAGPNHYIYALDMATQAALTKKERRTYSPWLKTDLTAKLPSMSDPDGEFPVVDHNIFPMQ